MTKQIRFKRDGNDYVHVSSDGLTFTAQRWFSPGYGDWQWILDIEDANGDCIESTQLDLLRDVRNYIATYEQADCPSWMGCSC